MTQLLVRMRTVTHKAEEYDRPHPGSGHLIHCGCGKRANSRDDLARQHQRSRRVIPGIEVAEPTP